MLRITELTPGGVLVFFSSYAVMNNMAGKWMRLDSYRKADVTIYLEAKENRDFKEIKKRFE